MPGNRLLLLTLALLIAPALSWSSDYKEWLPYVPDKLDGLKATSSPQAEGGNMSSGGSDISTFERVYGEGNKEIRFSILYGSSTGGDQQATEQDSGGPMSMELPGMVMKTVSIQGFHAMYTYLNETDEATIQLYLKGKAMVTLTSKGVGNKGIKHYVGLFDSINLKKIAATF